MTEATISRWLAVIGIGEDGIDGLSRQARALLQGAELVVGGRRHLALAEALTGGERLEWPSPMTSAYPAILARRGRRVAVLASGDPTCFGVASALARLVPAEETICLPVPSAFALARARLGWAAQATETVSFCGRPLAALVPLLQPGACILALSADAATPAAIAALLCVRGFGRSRLHVMEALGGPHERVRSASAEEFALADIHPLNLVAIEARAAPDAPVLPLAGGLPDELFEHDGQITKREIRAVTLSSLAPRRGEMLWDIGCGSGSVGIEWMLRHPANGAVAVDARAERAARAARNAQTLGVPGLRVVTGRAPDALAGLPAPDAVFIGGGGQDAAVAEAAWAALPGGGRLVVNAVTVETEAMLIGLRARLCGTLTRLSVERLDRIGTMHGFRPARTVTQWVAVKPW
jgi:precorrin-6Y C5,15-methyltransferase (decarboxylating)